MAPDGTIVVGIVVGELIWPAHGALYVHAGLFTAGKGNSMCGPKVLC